MRSTLAIIRSFSLTLSFLCMSAQAHAEETNIPPQALSDPAATHAPVFEQMLAHVYEENPQLRAERESLRILDEHVSESTAGFRPSLALTGEIGEARVSESNEAWRYGQDRNIALVATQPLYNGATFGQWHAAQKRVMEGRARLMAVEQKVLLTAITAWLDMSEKEKLFVLTRDNVKLTQSYLQATQQRQASGDGTQTDIAVAESRAADGETRYAMAESARDMARATYERATGMRAQITELPGLPSNLPHSSEETLSLASSNPELEQANYETAATADDVDAATGARWPYIYLRGTVSDEHAEDLGLSSLRGNSITINASIPLYQGGIEYAREREAKISHEKSRFDTVTIARNVREEAQQAWSHFRASQAVIQASDKAASASERALAGIDEEQKHGIRTLTEVLDAQAQSLNAQITALQAQTDLRMEAFRLMASIGRLTAKSLNLPTTTYDPVIHYDEVAARWFGTNVEPNDSDQYYPR